MPTTCVVVGCNNRKSKQSLIGFYRFPKRKEEEEHRRKWIAFVSRKNSDGSAWKPGKGARVCSEHFITGKKSNVYTNPDYVPSIKAKKPRTAECNATLSRFERASRRAKSQTERRRKEERDALELRRAEEEKNRRSIRGFNNDHMYIDPYTRQVENGEESREEPLMEDCIIGAELEVAELVDDTSLLIDLQPELLQPKHDIATDCCIPAEIECQTEVSWNTVEQRINLLETLLHQRPEFSVSTILKGNDKLTRFYTGMPTYNSFVAFVNYIEPKALHLQPWRGSETAKLDEAVSAEVSSSRRKGFSSLPVAEQLFAVLIKLRRGLESLDVSIRFKISETTYSRMFTTWITFLSKELRLLFPFPSRHLVQQWLPDRFKKFSNIRVIIDCYEIECQRPSGLLNSSKTYSQYKSRNTWKILVGCTPTGLISFVSEAWGGRISDKELTERSGLLDMLEPGDMIMADKGFDIQEMVAARGILVNVPPRLESKQKQMPASDVEKTRRIAELRIHVERAIGRGRRFKVLNEKFPSTMYDLVSDVNSVCMYITNFDNPLVV
ncbi:uncharacterized protein [Dysidea avara]|uniref:uncharacterized protein n=1 Tax=Dysidea avara TaxID=196820 RepID=UPI00332FE4E3